MAQHGQNRSHRRKVYLRVLGLAVIVAAGAGVVVLFRGCPAASPDGGAPRPPAPLARVNPSDEPEVAEGVGDDLLHALDDPAEQFLLDRENQAQLDRLKGEKKREAERKRVEQEPLEETVGWLAAHYPRLPMPTDLVSPIAELERLRHDARIARLLRIAADGPDEERAALRAMMLERCKAYTEELPLDSPHGPGTTWKASILAPGGAEVFPYALAELDEQGETLPLLVTMFDRVQEAARADAAPRADEMGLELVEGRITHTATGGLIAFACEHVLDRLAEGSASGTPEQKRVLSDYVAWQKSRPPKEVLVRGHYSKSIVFAADYCGVDITLKAYCKVFPRVDDTSSPE